MGNSNRRASPRPSQSGAVWDEANVLRLISEHKLAPKYGDSSSGKRSFECPICFLDFGILNTVNCCKQHICTDCLVQVKGSTGKGACPFCGNAELNASLVPLGKDKPTSTLDNNPKSADDRSNCLNSETERSSGGSTKALSYTTPEQEKKLRSYSLDDTTPSDSKGNGSNTHTASKNDREALERQIREQRLQFDERDLAEATARSARSSRGTHQQSGALYFRQAVRSRYGMASSSAGSPFGAFPSSRLADPERTTGNDGAQTASTNGVDRTATTGSRNAGNMQFVSSLEGLLQTHGSTRITSIQQLEDMMLMEAIRLSMQESAPSPSADSNNNNDNNINNTSSNTQSSLPAPPSPTRLSPFAPLSPARSGSLRSTPVGRTTTSASSPFRAFLTTNEVRVDASNDEAGRSSEDSGAAAQSEGEDDEEGYEQEEEEGLEFTYERSAYGRYGRRSSEGEEEEGSGEEEEEDDEELDEEEQIRLAVELSLADMRATTTATTTTTGAATTMHSVSNGNSATDTLCANTSMMNAASSIDTACVNPLGLIPLPNPNSDYSMKNTASEKRPKEEYVLKPHAEDTLPTATSSDALETEADTTDITDTTKTTNTDTINRTSDATNNALLTKTDFSTDGKGSEESTVSPQAVFAEVRL